MSGKRSINMRAIFLMIILPALFAGAAEPDAVSGASMKTKTSEPELNGRRDRQKGMFAAFSELSLSGSQQQDLQGIVQDFMAAMRKVNRDLSEKYEPGREMATARRESMEKLRQEYFDRAVAVLTPGQRIQLSQTAAPPGGDAGKSIPDGLLEKIGRTSSEAGSATAPSGNWIDSLTAPEAAVCSDEVFVRRAMVDLAGATPTVEDVLWFLNDPNPDKRARLIDELLESPAYAGYQALRWCDVLRVKSEFPIKLWPNAVAVYHRWVRSAMLNNMSYDEFARVLLTASGSNFRDPPVNFYRAVQAKEPGALADAVALAFMGVRTVYLPESDQKTLPLFFEQVAYKPTSEWKEEIVYWNRKPASVSQVAMPDGRTVELTADRDPRCDFADWLICPENEWFARAAVNRVWYWLFGTGIVQEPDDFRPDNPPSNPELLDRLAEFFVESGYDFHALYRLILNSKTWQQAAPGYPVCPLAAEVLQDTICRVFGTQVSYQSDVPEPFSYYPKTMRTVELPDGTVTSPFLQTFGRPSRDTGMESDRARTVTEEQRLFFINSTEVNGWIEKSWVLRVLPFDPENRELSLQYLWLNTLSRYPTQQELDTADSLIDQVPVRYMHEALCDLMWMLVNTKEFSTAH